VKRGDLYYVNPPGFLGKVRPAVIVQANAFNHNPPSVTLCLLTSTLADSRIRGFAASSDAAAVQDERS
jgi:mRNA-degrading endonuclease toxin of MazEF toxin-antitoxin module